MKRVSVLAVSVVERDGVWENDAGSDACRYKRRMDELTKKGKKEEENVDGTRDDERGKQAKHTTGNGTSSEEQRCQNGELHISRFIETSDEGSKG